MVDRGQLEGFRIGGHRRVALEDVERVAAGQHASASSFTFFVGVLLAAEVIADPDRAFKLARQNLERQRTRPTQSSSWTDQWQELIVGGRIEEIVAILTTRDDRSGLRQTHPFKGLLRPGQRERALAAAHR